MKTENNHSQIGDMYKRYYSQLMLIACSYTHDKVSAEDLVQEAFLKAILSYKAGGSLLCWAGKVIRNLFFNSKKKEKHLEESSVEDLSITQQEDLLKDYIKGEERVRLAAMIASLPEKYKSVMIESVYLQQENAQIAVSHGISEENVRQIKSRAKKMLIKMREEEDEKYRG